MGDTNIHWQRYNRALIDRGKVNFEAEDRLRRAWFKPNSSCDNDTYSDFSIKFCLKIRYQFNLTLRATQGFVQTLFKDRSLNLKVPNYTTLCRRASRLAKTIELEEQDDDLNQSIHLVVDSTGLKVHGEGEWKVRLHGAQRRRTWRKLHLAVDESNSKIKAVALSTNDFKDNQLLPLLMNQVKGLPVNQVTGDGAYDDRKCYKMLEKRRIFAVFPPRRDAKIHLHGNNRKKRFVRDEHIREIRDLGSREWKYQNNYHRRSLAESAMYRFKVITGDRLRSRKFENQLVESILKVDLLNSFKTPKTC